MRGMLIGAAVGVAGLLPMAAAAQDVAPWGVGPRIGTHFIPGRVPMAFPKEVKNDLVKGDPALTDVRGDVLFGVDGEYYAGDTWRLGLTGAFDLGKGYTDTNFIVHVDKAMGRFNLVDVLVGGGVGIGQSWWRGERKSKLSVPYYPFRAQAGVAFHQPWYAPQISVFTQYNLPSNQYYTNAAGRELDVKGGSYLSFGLDLTVYFGQLAFD